MKHALTSVRQNLSPFLKSSASMGLGTSSRLALGMIKNKVAAVVLGAEGMGIVGLVGQLQMLAATVTTFFVGNSITQMLSRLRESRDAAGMMRLMATAFTLLLILNFLLVCLLASWLREAAGFFLGREELYRFLLPLLVSVPVQSFLGTWVTAVFFSHQRILDHAKASIAGALVEVALFVLLLRHYGIAGALWGVSAGLLAWLATALLLAGRFFPLRQAIRIHLDKGIARQLFASGSTLSIVGVMSYGTNALIRAKLLKQVGAAETGIYHVAIVFTSLYMPFLTNGIWSRLHPMVSAKGYSADARNEWSEAALFVAVFGSLIQVAITCFAPHLIHGLYTKEFLPAARYIPYYMLGDFFFLLSQPTLAVFLARRQLRLFLSIWIVFYAIQLGGTMALAPTHGLLGAAYAYLAASVFIGLAGFWGFSRASQNLKTVAANVLFVMSCFGVVLSAIMLERYGSGLVPRFLLTGAWAGAVFLVYFHKPFREVLFR